MIFVVNSMTTFSKSEKKNRSSSESSASFESRFSSDQCLKRSFECSGGGERREGVDRMYIPTIILHWREFSFYDLFMSSMTTFGVIKCWAVFSINFLLNINPSLDLCDI